MPLTLTDLDTRNGWAGRDQIVYGRLWFEFLLFSPSYELARKHRAGLLSDTDRARLPKDIDAVLAVYDDLGDVQRTDFKAWWLAKGVHHLGYGGLEPRVEAISALLPEWENPLLQFANKADRYIAGPWQEQGQPPSLVLSIPMGMKKADMLRQVEQFFDQRPEEHSRFLNKPPKYKVLDRKKDISSIARLLMGMVVKAGRPEFKLHEVGAIAGLSTTYSARVARESDVEDRNNLKMLTSRSLLRGHMMAENAARGVFPSYERCQHAVAMDWQALGSILDGHYDWQDDQQR